MSSRPDLSIVILNWNARDYLRACLRSLEEYTPQIEFETIVVDNNSTLDNSAAMVAREFPSVLLVCNPLNSGFSSGNNLGWQKAMGRHVLFLNPDTIVEAGALEALVEVLDGDAKIGAVGPRMTYPDGELQFSARAFPSFGAGLFRNSFLGRMFPNNPWSRAYLQTDLSRGSNQEVDWLSGSAVCGSRGALEAIKLENGPWDEDYFMYCEDIDLCYRLMEKKWRRVYVPGATIQHHIGKSSDLAQAKSIRRHHAAMWLFYRKHYMKGMGTLLAPFAAFGIGMRAFFAVLKLCRTYARMGVLRLFLRRKARAKGLGWLFKKKK
ncbi:N-acetylglucosaminyl-diphospho-decaprenol L-rhamnosyltransferase [Abditibacteriota bacterium]|nr:N-acetylglucosaminyl-diphospho-decaprenol L-rhamnosyltransferase [Abditibacteriota bacterium]